MRYDELNVLSFEEYFEPMALTKKQKEERISLADALFDDLLFLFDLIAVYTEYDMAEIDDMIETFRQRMLYTVASHIDITEKNSKYIDDISKAIVESTFRNMEKDTSFLSEYRAIYVAEEQSNTLFNFDDYESAKANGKTLKRWLTMKDEKVRLEHWLVDDEVVGIDEDFIVDGHPMKYPRDINAPYYLTIGCRCGIMYI